MAAKLAQSVVFDKEPLQALADVEHPKHKVMLAKLRAVQHESSQGRQVRVVTPTAVRVEALVSRQAPGAAGLGLFRVRDVSLDTSRADRCVAIAAACSSTPVDTAVGQVAEEQAGAGIVTVYTSDLTDITRIVRHLNNAHRVKVRGV
jgi:hypothetical protein